MRRSTIIGALLAGGLALTGCTPSEEPSDQPPAPGTPPPATAQAHSGSGHSEGEGVGEGSHTSTDQEFAQQLLTHHEQLVEIVGLANQNSQNPQVKQLASEIQQAQQAEIEEIKTWLASTEGKESASAPEDTAAGASSEVPGLQQPAVVDQLRAARGPAFDQQWKQAVIALQEGALQLAQTELDEGSAEQMRSLAEKIAGSRQAEIDKVKSLA